MIIYYSKDFSRLCRDLATLLMAQFSIKEVTGNDFPKEYTTYPLGIEMDSRIGSLPEIYICCHSFGFQRVRLTETTGRFHTRDGLSV